MPDKRTYDAQDPEDVTPQYEQHPGSPRASYEHPGSPRASYEPSYEHPGSPRASYEQPTYEQPPKRAKVDDEWVTIKLPGGRGLAFRDQDYSTFTSHLPGLHKVAETSFEGDMGQAMNSMDVGADMIPFVLATVKNGEPPEQPFTSPLTISSILSKCGPSHRLRESSFT